MAGRVPEKDMWRYSSFWYKNFDDMAKKTLLRHIISRWGIMSIEMTTALEHGRCRQRGRGRADRDRDRGGPPAPISRRRSRKC